MGIATLTRLVSIALAAAALDAGCGLFASLEDSGAAQADLGMGGDLLNPPDLGCLCPAGKVCVIADGGWSCATACNETFDCRWDGPNLGCCNGACIDVASDPVNCGQCGMKCYPCGKDPPTCIGGQCLTLGCNPGFDNCDGDCRNGCETDTAHDPANCGQCGYVCQPIEGLLLTCTLGKCALVCKPGFADCNGNLLDGCEIDLVTDAKNCGGCGKVCFAPANSIPVCNLSKCAFGCAPNFADCDGVPNNGCEVPLVADAKNCGACGVVCAGGACLGGKCQ